MSYNRYKKFKGDGKSRIIPSVSIPVKNTDYFEVYERGKTRLDNISYTYYKDSNYDWLIMTANPEYGSMEFEIPDGSVLRIPFPLEKSLSDYEKAIDDYNVLYGIE